MVKFFTKIGAIRMEKNKLLSITRKFFKEKGCQIIKRTSWVYQTESFDVEFHMLHSYFGQYYYLDYYFYLHGIGAYYPDSSFSASGRVNDLMDTPEIYYLEVDPNDFAQRLERAFNEELLPISVQGLPYVVRLWQKNEGLFFRGTGAYMESLAKEMGARKE